MSVGIKTCPAEDTTSSLSSKEKYEKLAVMVYVRQQTWKLIILCCGFAKDGYEMYQGAQYTWRRGRLRVSALNSVASAPGSSPGQGHCVVFLGKTLYSHGASLHPGV